jgi:hypothetical protein
MTRTKFLAGFVAIVLMLAMPLTALANKRVYKASLSTANETHEVGGSSARGSMLLTALPNGDVQVFLSLRGLSGPALSIHLHAPAAPGADAPVVLTLCGGPPPAAFPACGTDTTFMLSGDVSASLLQGMGGGAFINALNDGLVYVNVHTALNPAGEARGQLLLANP